MITRHPKHSPTLSEQCIRKLALDYICDGKEPVGSVRIHMVKMLEEFGSKVWDQAINEYKWNTDWGKEDL